MDLAFVDKLAGQSKGIKFLLIAVDVFFCDWSRFKQGKQSMPKTQCMLSKKTVPRKETFWVVKTTKFGRNFSKFCKEKDIDYYSTMR